MRVAEPAGAPDRVRSREPRRLADGRQPAAAVGRPSSTSGSTSTEVSSSPNAKEPKATGPLPRAPDLVLDVGVRDDRPPPVAGLGEPVRAADLEPGGLAPADQAGAVADPGQGIAGVRQPLQQGADEVDGLRAHRAPDGGRRRRGPTRHGAHDGGSVRRHPQPPQSRATISSSVLRHGPADLGEVELLGQRGRLVLHQVRERGAHQQRLLGGRDPEVGHQLLGHRDAVRGLDAGRVGDGDVVGVRVRGGDVEAGRCGSVRGVGHAPFLPG